jgi:hypothetical protein
VSFAPRTFTTGMLACRANRMTTMTSLISSTVPPRGALKLYCVLVWDRRPPFARNKSKSNRESPPGWGVGQKSDATIAPDRRPSHSRIFFRRAGFSAGCTGTPLAIRSTYQRLLPAASARRTYLFSIACEPPGGGQKSGAFSFRTGGQGARIFSCISRKFFSTPGSIDPLRKNRREIQGGGG